MRVAIIISRICQLGPVIVIQNIVNSLSDNPDIKIKVFYLDKDVDTEMLFKVPVERLIRSEFCFSEFDIVHTNGIRPDLFTWINRRKIKYHISTIHNFVFEDLSFTYNRLISSVFGNIWLILWKRSDRLVCVSNTMRSYYETWFSSSKLEVIHNGVSDNDNRILPDEEVINAVKGFRSNGLKVLGSAGMLSKIKGIEQVLYLLNNNREFAFVLIGDGKELHNLRSLTAKLNISDRVYFCGFRRNAVSYFKYFDYFIMPSRSEGFGLALIEAVQQKVPVICSDIPVFRELFNKEEVTFFKLDNSESLVVALNEAKMDGSKKASLAYSKYLNFYTDKHMSQKYLELYQSA
jgi:glycosyltransferase involved in cell wall biosynthesis